MIKDTLTGNAGAKTWPASKRPITTTPQVRAPASTPSSTRRWSQRAALAYVVLLSAQQAQRIFTVKRTSVLLGRGDDVDIQLPDGSVSQHHARIVRQGKTFEVTDLDSTNGTFIRGKRVTRAALRNADRITLGTVDLMFLLDRPTNATIQIPDAFARIPIAAAASVVPGAGPHPPHLPPVHRGGGRSRSRAVPRRRGAQGGAARTSSCARAPFSSRVFIMVGVAGGMTSLFVSPPGVSAVAEVKLLPHMTLNSPTPEERWQNIDQDSPTFVKSAEYALTQREFVRRRARQVWRARPRRRANPRGDRKDEGGGDRRSRLSSHLQGRAVGPSGSACAAELDAAGLRARRGRQVAPRADRQGRLPARPAEIGGEGSGENRQPSAPPFGRPTPIGFPRTLSRPTAAGSTWRPAGPSCPARSASSRPS